MQERQVLREPYIDMMIAAVQIGARGGFHVARPGVFEYQKSQLEICRDDEQCLARGSA
jgi:hypothetical protein